MPYLTPAERLQHPCPRCGAGVGEKCRNYLGKGKQPCPTRGRPPAPAPPPPPPAKAPAGLFDDEEE